MVLSPRHDGAAAANNGRTKTHQQAPKSQSQSTTVTDRISDEDSELARFLFAGEGSCQMREVAGCFDRMRNCFGFGSDGMRSMGVLNSSTYSMALEPIAMRSDKLIRCCEVYTIFGALFFNGTWVLYEYGSHKAYGGDGTNEVVDRLFAAVMAVGICCNLCLCMFGSLLWLKAIIYSSVIGNFVIEARKLTNYCNVLLFIIMETSMLALFIGIYSNLSPHWPETAVVLSFAMITVFVGTNLWWGLWYNTLPLDMYHFPLLLRSITWPSTVYK